MGARWRFRQHARFGRIGWRKNWWLCDKKPPLLEDGRVDQGWVTWQKLRIDTRKWNASRILPKEYGEHVALKGDTAGGGLNIRIDLT